MKKLIFFTLVCLFSLVSCNNEMDTSLEKTELSCFGFSNANFVSMGTNHNLYLMKVYEVVNTNSCTNCEDDIINAFKALDIDVSGLGISLDSLINMAARIYKNLESNDIRTWKNPPFKGRTHEYLSDVMNLLDASSSYSDCIGSYECCSTS